MAKVRTSEIEDQLSVIAHLLTETEKNIKVLQKTADDLNLNKEAYKAFFVQSMRASTETIKSVTSQEIISMSKISDNVEDNQNKAIASINKTLQIALTKIEHATEQKIKKSKQVYLLAGIVAVVLGITTIFLEINRSIDKKTIAEAVQGKAEVEAWKADLKQWMSQNPKDAKSFIDWVKSKGK
jgi:uncharacterized membrane protein